MKNYEEEYQKAVLTLAAIVLAPPFPRVSPGWHVLDDLLVGDQSFSPRFADRVFDACVDYIASNTCKIFAELTPSDVLTLSSHRPTAAQVDFLRQRWLGKTASRAGIAACVAVANDVYFECLTRRSEGTVAYGLHWLDHFLTNAEIAPDWNPAFADHEFRCETVGDAFFYAERFETVNLGFGETTKVQVFGFDTKNLPTGEIPREPGLQLAILKVQ